MSHRLLRRSADTVELFAPAKINLFLSVLGKRSDGYHDLITVMAKVSCGDLLKIRRTSPQEGVRVSCPGHEQLEDENNLVCKAVRAWLQTTQTEWGVEVVLQKNLPIQAGLGGGSSNAVSALLGMNELTEKKLSDESLRAVAARLGSDCPGFLCSGLCLAEGRGETIREIDPERSRELRGQAVLLFRPQIGFATPEVYQGFSDRGEFSDAKWARNRVCRWESGETSLSQLLYNDLEKSVFEKHRYFSPLFREMEREFGIFPRMSGSGSCCFACMPEGFARANEVRELILRSWGECTWIEDAELID